RPSLNVAGMTTVGMDTGRCLSMGCRRMAGSVEGEEIRLSSRDSRRRLPIHDQRVRQLTLDRVVDVARVGTDPALAFDLVDLKATQAGVVSDRRQIWHVRRDDTTHGLLELL